MPLPRRALHQPFFPSYLSSPPTQSQPPQPSFPKYPSSSSSSSSSSDSPPFFPKYPSPPPPRHSPSLPTFPANISSLITPSRNAPASSKLIPVIALPILALILLSLIAAFFLLRRKQRSSGKGVQPGSDTSRLVPLQATSSSTSAPASSEFLYIGTLVSSRSPTAPPPVDLGPASADSPELRPLPPLSRQSRRSCSSDEEFFSPKGMGSPGGFKPPPPPPPPPPAAAAAARRPTPPALEPPRRKLKALHWDKVRASSERAMVWDQLNSSSFHFNEEMMESLFGCDSSNLRKKVAMSTMHEEYRVLDPKKSQNIAILMRALNVTKEEVCEALLEGNADSLGIELLETLLRMAPSKEEEIILKEYRDESPYKLGPAERFLKAILNIPFAFKRVDTLLYITNFESEVHYLNKSFQTLELACEELRSSRLFRNLLDAVLKTGNRMNLGTNRGDAQAFKLDTLLKLVDVKGTDGKTTLLHFVVQEISRAEGFRTSTPKSHTHSPKDDLEYKRLGLHVVSGLGVELSNVKKAATMDSEILSKYVSKLALGIGKIREVARLNESSDRFHETMISFLRVAEAEITKLQSQENLVLALVKETTEYFHGDLAKEEAHPFRIFMIVRDFLVILGQVCKDVDRINERSIVGSVPVSSGFLRVHSMRLGSSDDESNSSISSLSS